MTTRGSSRAKFIEAAADLLQTVGYHATGINQIVKKSGAPRGSLYFHFPNGKDQLVCAALRHSGECVDAMLQSAPPKATIKQIVQGIFDYFMKGLAGSEFQKGCPIATTALEIGAAQSAILETIQEIETNWQNTIVSLLVERGVNIERAKWLTGVLFSLLEGSLVQARMKRDTLPLEGARDLTLQLLEQER